MVVSSYCSIVSCCSPQTTVIIDGIYIEVSSAQIFFYMVCSLYSFQSTSLLNNCTHYNSHTIQLGSFSLDYTAGRQSKQTPSVGHMSLAFFSHEALLIQKSRRESQPCDSEEEKASNWAESQRSSFFKRRREEGVIHLQTWV